MSDESKQPIDAEETAATEGTDGDTTERAAVDEDAPTQQWSAVDGEAPEIDAAVAAAEELDAARREAADWKARAYRATADLENVRRRFQKEREELRRFAVEGLLKDMLPIVDNLERAVQHAEQNGQEGLVDGVKMVLRQFQQTLAGKGAEPFEALGQPFDPQLHEAMTEMPTTEFAPGHVASVFQRGWKLNGRLVRPAMVVVAKAPEGAEQGN
ncbi:MAG: nucleotide exchange factor GrpE [bacterium]|nr:nucleotide exchange factor GrpE [Myxococcales bacterium]MCB9543424.1 nucleotide exchange factor GrpE [Myxococcales bacterium]MCB9552210.1 nucleotide exchange factor GrpE [Myxococcales bacterium]